MILLAPSSVAPSSTFKLPQSGITYTVGANGFVSVTNQFDINTLISQGFLPMQPGGRNNLTATGDPGTGDDQTQNYGPGSVWLNLSAGRVWMNLSAATGAASWAQISIGSTVPGTAEFTNLIITALVTHSVDNGVVPYSGGGQTNAVLLTDQYAVIASASSATAPYDSVRLQPSTQGYEQTVINNASNPIQLFGTGADTINGETNTVGITIQPGGVVTCVCNASGLWIASGSGLGFLETRAYGTNTATSGTTLTAANVLNASEKTILNLTGTLTGAANAQLPTVASLVANIPNAAAGKPYELRIMNSSSGAFTWTVTTNTGWTLSGAMTIAQNTWRDFLITINSLTAATIQDLGGGNVI
jgi:hypothetical protein